MISPETTSAGQFLRPELPEEALYGLPGDVIGALAPTTEADPAVLLLTFMTMFGNVIGAEPHVAFGGADHPGRLFVLIAGDAATSRKGTSLSVIEKLGRPGIWPDHRRPVGPDSSPRPFTSFSPASSRGNAQRLVRGPDLG